jgi:hypothetical protein
MSIFLKSADARETSMQIMEAIWTISRRDEAAAERIWAEPDGAELIAIWEIVTKNGLIDEGAFFWGAAGNDWNAA